MLTGRHGYLNTGAVLPARAWRGGIEVCRLRDTGCGRFPPGRALDCASFMASAFLALLVRARPGDDPRQDRSAADLGHRLAGGAPDRRPPLVNWCQDLFPENAAAMGLRVGRGAAGTALRALRNVSGAPR